MSDYCRCCGALMKKQVISHYTGWRAHPSVTIKNLITYKCTGCDEEVYEFPRIEGLIKLLNEIGGNIDVRYSVDNQEWVVV